MAGTALPGPDRGNEKPPGISRTAVHPVMNERVGPNSMTSRMVAGLMSPSTCVTVGFCGAGPAGLPGVGLAGVVSLGGGSGGCSPGSGGSLGGPTSAHATIHAAPASDTRGAL